MARTTLGLIVGNRDVFPAELAREGREKILPILRGGIDVVALTPKDTPDGVVLTWKDAEACAAFSAERAKIDGILVTLPNFGDERAVADSIKLSGLSVPVYIHAYPDKVERIRHASSGAIASAASSRSATILPSTAFRTRSAGTMCSRPIRRNSRKSSTGSPGSAAWCAGCTARGSAAWANGPCRSRRSATAKNSWSKAASASKSKSMVETVSEINALSDSDERVAGQAEEARRLSAGRPGRARGVDGDHGEARRGARPVGRRVSASTPMPSSAGRPCRTR